MLDHAVLQSVAKQLLNNTKIDLDGKISRVTRTSSQHLRTTTFELDGRKCLVTCSAVAVFLPVTVPLGAQTSNADADRIAKLEQQIADAKSSADNSWMLTRSALVLMMTGPGLALFYGGLVRKKNVLGTQ